MAKKGKSKFAILGMLALNPGSSGYDIKKMIETSIQYCWKESFGSIYPMLSELEKEKLIKQEKPTQQVKLWQFTNKTHSHSNYRCSEGSVKRSRIPAPTQEVKGAVPVLSG